MNDYTLLYVEDDTDFAELNVRWFTARGYHVLFAQNGNDAIDLFRKMAPDIVLLDVMLPDMSGFDVCKRLQKLDATTPVLFLTSLADSENAIRGLDLGAFDYIRKETDLAEIEARIKTTLARTEGRNGITRITENSYIDNRQMEIVVGDERHKSTPRIIKLLHLLTQRKNCLCERGELIERLWGRKSVNGDAYLNQTVGILRRLLSGDPLLQIVTFRNSGIMLKTDE